MSTNRLVSRADIFRVFRKHRGEVVWIDELLALYEGKPDEGHKQSREDRIYAHIRNLRNMDHHHIETVYKGRAWRYGRPKEEVASEPVRQPIRQVATPLPTQPAELQRGDLLEIVHVAQTGSCVAVDSNGNEYLLRVRRLG